MKRKSILILISMYQLFMMLACTKISESKESSARERMVKCDTVIAAHGFSESSSFPGKIISSQEVNLSFRVSGPLSSVYCREGDFVRKGQVVARIDDRDYLTQFNATSAEYDRIKSEADRVIELYQKQSVSANDNDKAVYGLKQIESKLEAHRNALHDTKLVAPFDGYVQRRFYNAGETVAAGMPVLSIISVDNMEVEINIPTQDFIKHKRIKSAKCKIEPYADMEYDLQLIGVNQKANLNQLYQTRFLIKDSGSKPRPAPGMAAMVAIDYEDSKSGDSRFIVPVSSLLSNEGGQTKVWIYNNGLVELREVQVIQMTLDGRAVVSGDLEPGEMIVSAGARSIENGQKVRMLSATSNTNVGGLL